MKFASAADVESLINTSPAGRNTKFLSASHSLWTRFKNYDKSPPMILEDNGKIVSLIFATFNRDRYTNLYEIVTAEGCEGKGYASRIWNEYVDYAVNVQNMKRLKISCTPSSVTWHMKNGLVFWAVDPTGSLRSDQPLFKSREEQLMFRRCICSCIGRSICRSDCVGGSISRCIGRSICRSDCISRGV